MKFSEEYKKSAESMSPDRQTIDRMKAAVLKELQEHPDTPAEPLENPKKPLPLRRIAYIGGAVAACAVITVAAVNIVPTLETSNGMISSSSDSMPAIEEIAGAAALPESSLEQTDSPDYPSEDIMEDAAADEIPANDIENDISGITSSDIATDAAADQGNPNIAGIESAADSVYPFEALPADSDTAADTYDNDFADEPQYSPGKGHTTPSDNKVNEFAPATSEVPALSTEEPNQEDDSRGNPEAGFDGLPNEWQPTEDAGSMDADSADSFETTMEVADTEEECQTSESLDDDQGNPNAGGADTIVISPKGWLTYNGERYDIVKKASAPADTYSRYETYAPTEGNSYYVVINDDMLYLYDIRMNFLGGYKKR